MPLSAGIAHACYYPYAPGSWGPRMRSISWSRQYTQWLPFRASLAGSQSSRQLIALGTRTSHKDPADAYPSDQTIGRVNRPRCRTVSFCPQDFLTVPAY